MRAKTHPGDEKKVKSSSDHKTTDSEDMKQPDQARGKGNREIEQTGLTVDDISQDSAYEKDQQEISHIAENSDRNEKAN